MTKKPTTAEGYDPQMAVAARRMCLYVATILGDLIDKVVVVGGLVPYLIIDQADAQEPHVGIRDLDLGLSLALLDDARYREVSDRLRNRGFEPGKTDEGRVTRQTWVLQANTITIDFLIPRSDEGPAPGKLQNLEGDFAAIVTAALTLAFRDVIEVTIDARTPPGELAKRTVRVSGPAAFDVLWDEGVLLVRRSHTRRQEVMDTTKTKLHQTLPPPDELMEILKWQVEYLRRVLSRTLTCCFRPGPEVFGRHRCWIRRSARWPGTLAEEEGDSKGHEGGPSKTWLG